MKKCKVYYVSPNQYTTKAGTLTPKDYICYYELIGQGIGNLNTSRGTINLTIVGEQVADLPQNCTT